MHDDPTYSDPTEYQRPREPRQIAYRNPYETPNPYYGDVPIPPPPPKKRRTGLIVALASILCVVVILGGVLFWVTHVGVQQAAKQVTTPGSKLALTPKMTVIVETPTPGPPTPTTVLLPTATPVRTVAYFAKDIYNDFYANGLGGPDPKTDNNWNCCTYNPAGGAIVWTDNTSRYTLDIATFYNTSDAEVDASDLYRQGYYSNVVHNCLLSYEKSVPITVLSGYVQLMQTYCN